MECPLWLALNLNPHPHTPIHQDDNFFGRGDSLIHGLWEKQTAYIIDVRVTDTDQTSYLSSSPSKIIANQERETKKKYLDSCLQ